MNVELETLYRISKLDHYINWKIEIIRPYIGNRVLEVGTGIGTYSPIYLNSDYLILSDINEEYLSILRKKYKANINVFIEYCNIDKSISHFAGREIDTIVALDVLEHICDDSHTLTEMASILSPGGRLILLIPAHKILYGSLDIHLKHYRRYSVRDIRKKLKAAGYEVERLIHFNMFGVFGWFLCSRILHSKVIPNSQLKIFNWLTPIFIKIEQLIPVPFGVSMIVVGRKI